MSSAPASSSGPIHQVVVIGGGFGGLAAAHRLGKAPVEVTLIDRRNFHLFQPLTYQVATGALSPGEITCPLRAVFKGKSNVRVVLASVSGFDSERRQVLLDPGRGSAGTVVDRLRHSHRGRRLGLFLLRP